MIDIAMIDKLFESGRATGVMMSWQLFDKRLLLPIEALSDAVARESDETITADDVKRHAAAGWFAPLKREAPDTGMGVPLYVPSRIAFYAQLARDGHTDAELRAYATFEEWFVDTILASAGWPYIDDDLELLIAHYKERIEGTSSSSRVEANGNVIDQSEDRQVLERQLAFVCRLQRDGIEPRFSERIARHAFRVRALNDVMRTMQLAQDRDKIRAGYSPWVLCSERSWSTNDGYRGSDVRWDGTIRTAIANFEGDPEPPIRVPGFLIRGERIVPLRTLRPSEYETSWRSLKLDGYLHAWSALKGERRCLQCVEPLPSGATSRKRFCGDKCRNIAKQRRFRDQNPEGADRARKRYPQGSPQIRPTRIGSKAANGWRRDETSSLYS